MKQPKKEKPKRQQIKPKFRPNGRAIGKKEPKRG